jgi:hypothetical protein
MTTMLRSMVPAMLASMAVASVLEAQAVPVVSLTKPEAEFAEPFDQVSAVRELSNGRVVVADVFAKSVAMADFRSGALTKIGREGQGPGEYAFPVGVLALPADTTLIVDPAQRRFVKVAPDGKAVALVSFPEGAGGMGNMRGTDAQGRVYLQANPFGRALGEAREMPDSAPILRWNPANDRIDTIARIKLPEIARASSGTANARSIVMRQQPFSGRDEWAVAPDGRVGVARVADYHVEWHGSAKVAGARVAAPKVPVTQADKDIVNRAANDTRGRMMVVEGGSPRSSGGAPPPPPQLPEPDWPEFKPPFLGNVYASSDGRLWVQRAQPANAAPLYDVFDARGRLVQQVKLAQGTRLVGFGANTIYTARTDEDELQYLQRYRMP